MGVPDTAVEFHDVVLQLFFELGVVSGDVLQGVFDGEDAVSAVLAFSVGAVHAEKFVLSEAVEGQDVVVAEAPHRHLVAAHQPQQLHCRLQLLASSSQLPFLPLQHLAVVLLGGF